MPLTSVLEKGRVKLALSAVAGSLATITRTPPSGSAHSVIVRGADLVPLSGGTLLIYDYEMPIGVPVTYQAQAFDASDTSTPLDTSDPVTVTWNTGYEWLKDPLEPIRNMAITLRALPTQTFTSRTGVFPILGRPNSVTVGEVRGSATGTIQFITYTQEERERLHYITSSGHALLLQGTQESGIGNLYFAPVGDLTLSAVIEQSRTEPRRFWEMGYEEVDPPIGAAGPTVTYADVESLYPGTYQDIADAGYTSYLDLIESVGRTAPPPVLAWRGS